MLRVVSRVRASKTKRGSIPSTFATAKVSPLSLAALRTPLRQQRGVRGTGREDQKPGNLGDLLGICAVAVPRLRRTPLRYRGWRKVSEEGHREGKPETGEFGEAGEIRGRFVGNGGWFKTVLATPRSRQN